MSKEVYSYFPYDSEPGYQWLLIRKGLSPDILLVNPNSFRKSPEDLLSGRELFAHHMMVTLSFFYSLARCLNGISFPYPDINLY